jgi:hypothetical protein
MQLPRGKFREIVRGVPLGPLLLELNEVQYTGILKATWDTSSSTLVFQNGLVILAEYPPYAGDAAWDAITLLGNLQVGGILSDLDGIQMRLVLEFNGPFLLTAPAIPGKGSTGPVTGQVFKESPVPPRTPEPVPAGVSAVQFHEPPPVPSRPNPSHRQEASRGGPTSLAPGVGSVQPGLLPATQDGTPGTTRPPRAVPPGAGAMVLPSVDTLKEGIDSGSGDRPPAMDPATLASLEMEALDDVDVDHIANKVRKNARGIVKKLHLGHLMTEKDE